MKTQFAPSVVLGLAALLVQSALACSPPAPKIGPDGKVVVDPYKYHYTATVVGLRQVMVPYGRTREPKLVQALELQVVESQVAEIAVGSIQLVFYPSIGADCSSEPSSYSTDLYPLGAKVTVRGNRADAAFVERIRDHAH